MVSALDTINTKSSWKEENYNSMIIASISCGMGNQMFSYAAGFAVSERLGTELVLDLEWYKKKQPRKDSRPYELGCFPRITERKASFSDVYRLFPFQAVKNYLYGKNIFLFPGRHLVKQIMIALMLLPEGKSRKKFLESDPLLLPIPHSRVFTQDGSIYSEKFMMIPDDVYMCGDWQNEKFFDGYYDDLKKRFTFAPEYFNSEYADDIRSCNSVAVHVRLGDKLRRGEVDFTREYLSHSIRKILSLSEDVKFFVFSDDIKWCKNNMHDIYDTEYTFIEGGTPAQDMALMTICRHVITSASTFSWWGAWLNDNPNKIVIAPAQKLWCKDDSFKDIYPSEWILIE